MQEWQREKNKRAIAIYRVSGKRQENNASLETQKSITMRYRDEFNLDLVKEFIVVESAKDADERKQYNAAMDWADQNGILHVLWLYNNREARNLTDTETNEKRVKSGKAILHYVQERHVIFKGSSDTDFYMRDMQAVNNKHFSRHLSSRMRAAWKHKAECGWYPGNHPPLGYAIGARLNAEGKPLARGKIIVADPDEKKLKQVQMEFELRAKGFSYDAIRQQIIDEGFIPPKRQYGYSKGQIEQRIKSCFYRGYFTWDGVEHKGKHELIIPPQILRAVDATLGKGRLARRPFSEHGIFSGGWLKCALPECGLQITYDATPKIIKATQEKKINHYYHCTNSRKIHSSFKGMNVTEESLWEQFETCIDTITLTKSFSKMIADALNDVHERAKAATRRQADEYRLQVQQLNLDEDELYDRIKTIGEDMFRRQQNRVRDKRNQIMLLLEQTTNAISDAFMETSKTILQLATDAKSLWNEGTPLEKYDLLKLICSNPVLDGKNLRYELKSPFKELSEMKENEEWRHRRDSNLRPFA